MRYLLRVFLFLMVSAPLQASDGLIVRLTDSDLVQPVGMLVEYWEQQGVLPSPAAVYDGSMDIPWQRSRDQVVNIGYSRKPYWFRFQVKNITEASDWYFVLDLPLVRALDIYIQKGSELVSFYHLGDRFEFAARPVDHRNYVVPVKLEHNEMLTFYVRMDSTYAIQFPAYFVEETRFLKTEITNGFESKRTSFIM